MQQLGDWLNEGIVWLTQYNAFLTLLFSCAVAIATIVYARLTGKLVHETVQLRKAETDPDLVVYLEPHIGTFDSMLLIVQNIGHGPAYDVSFTYTQRPPVHAEVAAHLAEIALFKGVPFIAPGQRFAYDLGLILSLFDDMPGPVIVDTTCTSRKRERLSGSFTLNIAELAGIARLGRSPLDNIAEQTKSIAQALDRLSSQSRLDSIRQRMASGAVPTSRPPQVVDAGHKSSKLLRWRQRARRYLAR